MDGNKPRSKFVLRCNRCGAKMEVAEVGMFNNSGLAEIAIAPCRKCDRSIDSFPRPPLKSLPWFAIPSKHGSYMVARKNIGMFVAETHVSLGNKRFYCRFGKLKEEATLPDMYCELGSYLDHIMASWTEADTFTKAQEVCDAWLTAATGWR